MGALTPDGPDHAVSAPARPLASRQQAPAAGGAAPKAPPPPNPAASRPGFAALPGMSSSTTGAGSTGGTAAAEPPEEYIDPISQELMLDPVLLVETGQSYERSTIEAWFQRCTDSERPCTDPLTRKVLRHTTLVSNYALKSLINNWASSHRIQDLPGFSKRVAQQRTMARGSGAAALAAEAVAALHLEGRAAGSSYGSPGAGSPQQQQQGRQPGDWGAAVAGGGCYPVLSPPSGAAQADGHSSSSRPPLPPHGPSPLSGAAASTAAAATQQHLYPTMHHPPLPPMQDKRQQAESALGALREAVSRRSSGNAAEAVPASQGAAGYHAWSLMQLAGDREGRRLLWENNAIPLAIYLLGQQEAAGLDAAKPPLCGTLQRLAAQDAEMAASIAQCGGVQALVLQLTGGQLELRAAACRTLYFLGWQGSDIRDTILQALSEHAAACRLPPRPLLAFWRFWDLRQQPGDSSSSDGAGGNSSRLWEGREVEWEALTCLLHMLTANSSSSGGGGGGGNGAGSGKAAASQQQRAALALDVTATAVPAVLAHTAAASEAAASRYAAFEAAKLLAAVPPNLGLLLEGSLLEAQQAASEGDSTALANCACLVWDLCYNSARGSPIPAAMQLVQQHSALLLPALGAALEPRQQKPGADCKRVAAGLLACLMYEPAQQGDAVAAAQADGMRRLLASPSASSVLQSLLALLQPVAAAQNPKAAAMAALAVANMAAYRGAVSSSGGGSVAVVHPVHHDGGGVGARFARLGAALQKRISPTTGQLQEQLAQHAPAGGAGAPGAAAAAASGSSFNNGGGGASGASGAGPHDPQQQQQPSDPRGALLFHGTINLLLLLVLNSSSAASASDVAAAAARAEPVGVGMTPEARRQAAEEAAAATEAAAVQRSVLWAALQALNNLCVDPAAVQQLRAYTRSAYSPEVHQQIKAALSSAMSDRQLGAASREQARLLLLTESGAPGQRHALACSIVPPPTRQPAYPNP